MDEKHILISFQLGKNINTLHNDDINISEEKIKSKLVENILNENFNILLEPEQYLDPTTNKIMNEPVVAADGITYDKLNIEKILEKNEKSPILNEEYEDNILRANKFLKKKIFQYYKDKHEILLDVLKNYLDMEKDYLLEFSDKILSYFNKLDEYLLIVTSIEEVNEKKLKTFELKRQFYIKIENFELTKNLEKDIINLLFNSNKFKEISEIVFNYEEIKDFIEILPNEKIFEIGKILIVEFQNLDKIEICEEICKLICKLNEINIVNFINLYEIFKSDNILLLILQYFENKTYESKGDSKYIFKYIDYLLESRKKNDILRVFEIVQGGFVDMKYVYVELGKKIKKIENFNYIYEIIETFDENFLIEKCQFSKLLAKDYLENEKDYENCIKIIKNYQKYDSECNELLLNSIRILGENKSEIITNEHIRCFSYELLNCCKNNNNYDGIKLENNINTIFEIYEKKIGNLNEKMIILNENFKESENKNKELNITNKNLNEEIVILKEKLKKSENKNEILNEQILNSEIKMNDLININNILTKKINILDLNIEECHCKNFLLENIQKLISANIELKMIFKASKDGFDAKDFHKHCDYKEPILIIVKSEFDKYFGGFANTSFQSGDGFFKYCDKAFIFSIEREYISKIKEPSTAIYCSSDKGPEFGNDIEISSNCDSNRDSKGYNFGYSYQLPLRVTFHSNESKSWFSGSENNMGYFKVIDYEAWICERKQL